MDTKLKYQSVASLNVNLNRQSYGPLDLSEAFTSKADLDYYRSGGQLCADVKTYPQTPYPYAGQIVSLVDNDQNTVAIYKLVPNKDGYFDAVQIDGTVEAAKLPVATKTSLGAIKIGNGLEVSSDGTVSAQKLNVVSAIDNTTSASTDPASTKAVYDFTTNAINALDMSEISVSSSETIASISETDGIISVKTQSIKIDESQVNGLTDKLSSIETDVQNLNTQKLDAKDFTDLSNLIGLSAATGQNHVVTQDDIKALEGVLHFRGATGDDKVVDDYTGKPNDIARYKNENPIQGDVILHSKTSKEFVFSGTFNDSGKWIELGDEDLYAKKTDVNDKISSLEADLNTLNTAHTNDVNALSTAIDNKLFIDGHSTATLSIAHIDSEAFHQKVVEGSLCANELYIVSSDNFNCYGERMMNVGAPVDLSDAANKEYVDSQISSSTAVVVEKVESQVEEVSAYAHNLSASQLNWDDVAINGGAA